MFTNVMFLNVEKNQSVLLRWGQCSVLQIVFAASFQRPSKNLSAPSEGCGCKETQNTKYETAQKHPFGTHSNGNTCLRNTEDKGYIGWPALFFPSSEKLEMWNQRHSTVCSSRTYSISSKSKEPRQFTFSSFKTTSQPLLKKIFKN